MKTFYLNNSIGDTSVDKMKNIFSANCVERWGESFLDFNNELGRGSLQIISFEGGVSTMFWDIYLNEEISLVMNFGDFAPIEFIYILNGNMNYNKTDEESIFIDNCQNSIVGYENNTEYSFSFPKSVHFKMHIIQVLPHLYNDKRNSNIDLMHPTLRNQFTNRDRRSFLYFGEINLVIADKIKEKNSFFFEGATRTTLLEGLTYYILALQIEGYRVSQESKKLPKGLTKNDIKILQKCSNYIEQNLSTINLIQLLEHFSISASKLQTGFKYYYGITVNAYIKEKRLSKALQLFNDDTLNVSEICFSIGYDSKSYFSKIFKKRFGLSPSLYRKGLQKS